MQPNQRVDDADVLAVASLSNRRVWLALRTIGMAVGLLFMGWLLWKLLHQPQTVLDNLSIPGVCVAIVVGVIANAAIGLVFSDLVGKSAPDIGFDKRISAYYSAQIAKYIPGRIAALMVQRSILSGPNATAATLISNLELMVVSAWLCSAAALSILAGMRSVWLGIGIALFAIAFGAWLMRANWQSLLRRLPFISRLASADACTPAVGKARAAILASSIFLLPAASSFLLLFLGMDISPAYSALLTAMLLLSWVGGMLAIVFPAGIGVREFLFMAMGSAVIGQPTVEFMAGIAIASRLAQIMVDLIGVLAFLVYRKLRQGVTP